MSPSRSLPRILFVLLVILLGSTQLYGQSLSASPSQVVAGSTQSVTVTWSCAAGDSGCAPNWNQFAFPVYFGGNGSLTLYPGWVNCGGDPPNRKRPVLAVYEKCGESRKMAFVGTLV